MFGGKLPTKPLSKSKMNSVTKLERYTALERDFVTKSLAVSKKTNLKGQAFLSYG